MAEGALATTSRTLPVVQAARLRLRNALRMSERMGAWAASALFHACVVALAVWGLARQPTAAPPMRVVLVEPPPPPALPLGDPDGARNAPPASEPVLAVEKARQRTISEPLKPRVIARPRPPRARPSPDTQPGVARELPAGSEAGAVGGTPAGQAGGVAGGFAGGMVGGRGTEPMPTSLVASPPVVVKRVVPEYPEVARRAGIEGLVRLEAILDESGRVEDSVRVLQSVPELDRAAIEAFRQWRFAPARDHDGRAVRVVLEVPIRFTLRR